MTEQELISCFNKSKSVLLVEPPYKRKYPPLGLMKISSYFKSQNKKVEFLRNPIQTNCDLICLTTLFTYDYNIVCKTVKELRFWNPDTLIIIGGIAASIQPNKFSNIVNNVQVFTGFSDVLDQYPCDYETDFNIESPWDTYSYLFTTRGCPNNCAYCFVPKIEANKGIIPNWKKQINTERKNVMIFDNNITAYGARHVSIVAKFCNKYKLKVRLDNAIDCKYIDEDMAIALSELPIEKRGYRTAFDRITEDGVFQDSIKLLISKGISKYNIMAYVLFNFTDTVKEADYRARECANLGVTPYPQCFQPVNAFSRSKKYISSKWTKRLTTAFSHFWIYANMYLKYDFITYIKTEDGKKRYKLTDKDYIKLN